MIEKKGLNIQIGVALTNFKGIITAASVVEKDRQEILHIEEDAEKRSLMGLGKVINTGVRKVLQCDFVYAALTSMDFDWGCHSTLLLKKGDEIVGEEVRDPVLIATLSKRKGVWFLHRNFVVYKDRISFPKDIMEKICHFEIPALPAEWLVLEDSLPEGSSIIFASPTTPSDVFIKKQYFEGCDERGLGTILVGANF